MSDSSSGHRPFRIAHLSDLHLTADNADARHEPKLANRLTGMNDTFRRIAAAQPIQQADLMLVTGDITDQGQARAWQQFRKTVADAGLAARTLVVLGNHDVCSLSPRIGSHKELRRTDLDRARRGLVLCGQPARYPWALEVRKDIVVFGLDSNNSGNLSPVTNAIGRLGFRQLAAFAGLLHKHRDAAIKIVMLHHSPSIANRPASWRRGRPPVGMVTRWLHQLPEEDRRAFRLLCLTHRVRLILHGHLHEAEDRLVNGLRIVGAPAATEPLSLSAAASTPRRFPFFHYTVGSPSGRITRALRTIALPVAPAARRS
jgi:3',5'-cyclic AMP phosphodiesterase CpdA